MSVRHLRLLWLWGGLLVVLLCLFFLPLTAGGRIFTLLLTVAAVSAAWWFAGRRWRVPPTDATWLNDLPDSPYRLPLVLVCGDTPDWPGGEPLYRSARGCWLRVSVAELQQTVRYLLWNRPELVSQVTVMFGVCPQQYKDEAALTARLHALRWQLGLVRRDARRAVPLLLVSTVAGTSVTQPLWQTAQAGETVQVWQADSVPCSAGAWLSRNNTAACMAVLVRMNALASLTAQTMMPALTADSDSLPPVVPAMLLYHQKPSSAVPVLPDSLWSRWLSRHTALNVFPGWQPDISSEGAMLPDFILPLLPRGQGEAPRSLVLRRAFCLFTFSAVIALLSSGWNNRQLLHRVSFDIARYDRILTDDYRPKADAVMVLREDAALLDSLARNGVPLRMSLGLYQGERLRLPVLEAIRSYVPPPLPAEPQPEPVTVPETVRLDSLSLFDSGKSVLKADSTKVLVNVLVGIKAKPGWLIVVSGHTDNTGNPKLNQTLSLKRAEAVRDWMRDTGDVPESCFAVQGYGESRPVATNDTPEGRALNRRVEIRLVPQANACQIPDHTPSSSQDDGASQH
ncbi:TPA: OmpA family protein [Klebsiella oxytoca]|uniref:OmpA family protein n=1 Tax=Klebsiella oxytoca TaxID=571 RepID=A0AAN5L9V4_KLEOX|nr:OmpA family protein [Klebsiella oxytoca]